LLSIAILGETLDVASDTSIFPRREEFYGRLTWELHDVGKRLLQEAGWCTSEIAALYRNFPDMSSLYYLSTWDRSKSGKNQSSCTGRCLANQVDEKTYKTRHTDPKCHCEHLPVEKPQAIFEILDEGGISVVLFTDAGKVHIQNSVPNDNSGKRCNLGLRLDNRIIGYPVGFGIGAPTEPSLGRFFGSAQPGPPAPSRDIHGATAGRAVDKLLICV
jgi:hypothetical protein